MAKTLTIELTDKLEQQVMVQAKQQQVSPESIVLQSLNQTLTTNQVEVQNHESQSALTQVQLEASRQRLLKFAGAISLGHTTGLDNESIDADLAKAYGNQF